MPQAIAVSSPKKCDHRDFRKRDYRAIRKRDIRREISTVGTGLRIFPFDYMSIFSQMAVMNSCKHFIQKALNNFFLLSSPISFYIII